MTSMVYIFHPDYAKTVFQAPYKEHAKTQMKLPETLFKRNNMPSTFWSVLWYNVRHVRMLFPSIETGTAMNVRESETYLPISRSFSASK
jgi:hypothetical protein